MIPRTAVAPTLAGLTLRRPALMFRREIKPLNEA
jgi:hypothetical protein